MTEKAYGQTNAQRAMSAAEEYRAGAKDECTKREIDEKHNTKAKHDDERMRERWPIT